MNQLGVLFDENTLSLSVDNKNKVEVGIPATNRRSKINKFYLKEFSPNYFDHDFPHVVAKLVPAGYQILKHEVASFVRSEIMKYFTKEELIKGRVKGGTSVYRGRETTHEQLDRKKVSDVVEKTSRKFKHVPVSVIHRHINEKGRKLEETWTNNL